MDEDVNQFITLALVLLITFWALKYMTADRINKFVYHLFGCSFYNCKNNPNTVKAIIKNGQSAEYSTVTS